MKESSKGWPVVFTLLSFIAGGGVGFLNGQKDVIAEGQRAGFINPISNPGIYKWNTDLRDKAAANKEVMLVPVGPEQFKSILEKLTNEAAKTLSKDFS